MTKLGNSGAAGDNLRQARVDLLATMVAGTPRSQELHASLDRVLELAERFALTPRVASRVRPDDAGRLAELNAATAARNSLLVHAARAIGDVLAAAGIPSILLKGCAMLVRGVAADFGERHSDDVDVLVPRGSRDRAFATLLEAGYTVAESASRPAMDGRMVAEQEVRAGGHSAPTLMSPFGIPVDLHGVIPDAKLPDFDALAPHCERGLAGALLVPRPPVLFAQICDHVIVHHQARPTYVARHVADVAAFEARYGRSIWQEMEAFCHPVSSRASRALLLFARGGSDLAGRWILPSEPARVAVELVWESRDVVARLRRDLARDPSRVLRKLWPDRAYVAASYGTDVDDARLPYLYLHRLATFRWLLRPFYG